MRPVASAILTSYNHARYVGRALESALAQRVEGLEVIAIDDASSDGSREILERFAGAPGLRLELHDANLGVSPVFNRGLALARGEFVAFLGSDDYWLPDHLGGAIDALREAGAALCYGRVRIVDAEDRDVSDREDIFGSAPDEAFFAALLRRSNFVPFVSCVMRREAVLEVGGFDESLVTLQDYDLWLRLAARAPVRFLDRTSAAFRWHAGNTSRRSAENSVRLRRELAAILERWMEQPEAMRRADAESAVRRRLAASYRRLARRLADPRERASCYRRSLRLDPYQPATFGRLLASSLAAQLAAQRRNPPG